MPSSERLRALAGAAGMLAALAHARPAAAQKQAEGFGVERFYPSAPGGGWFVMDTLDMRGGLGGAAAMTVSYAHNPLRVDAGNGHLAVVSDEAVTDFGFAATYRRFRLYLNFDVPVVVKGTSGTADGEAYSAPDIDPGSHPDTFTDARIGFDTRLLGEAGGRLRLGVGAQLYIPNGTRIDYASDGSPSTTYVTDHTYRGMGRVLVAGDVGRFSYAGNVGVHIRPLDDSSTPGSPQGSELLFGAAGGVTLDAFRASEIAVVLGPEIYGATAFAGFFGGKTTALEGLLTARAEGTKAGVFQLRVKAGAGGGLNPEFGAPEARVVVGVEVFDNVPK